MLCGKISINKFTLSETEEECLSPVSLASIPSISPPKALLGLINNPFSKNTLNTLIKVCKQTEGLRSIYEQTHFCKNPRLTQTPVRCYYIFLVQQRSENIWSSLTQRGCCLHTDSKSLATLINGSLVTLNIATF